MVVRRLARTLTCGALAALVLPMATATPEVHDVAVATVFVDGGSDYFEFHEGHLGNAGTWVLSAPDGTTATVFRKDVQVSGGVQRWLLDGTQSLGPATWQWIGDLSGAAADGTWTLTLSGAYSSHSIDGAPALLVVQGRSIRFDAYGLNPSQAVQAWNWHVGPWTDAHPWTEADLPDEGPEEDPQRARFFSGAPVRQSVPGADGSRAVPGQDVDAPPFTVPATCTVGPCDAETPLGSTPSETVPEPCTLDACNGETPVVAPGQPVPRTCAPLDVVCIGPFAVPPQDLGDAPAVCDAALCVGPVTIPSQDLGDAPAVCDVAGELCVGPIPVPAQDVVQTQPVTVAVGFTGLDVLADPHAADLTPIGPFDVVVPVPAIGDVPVTVCASTCPFPVSPEGETGGSLTVTVAVGAEERSLTVPLDQSL